MRAQEFISEISDEQLQRYLDRAGRQVDARQERMARVRDRLNKGYEIYHAETPNKIVDRFEANTPQEAKRYYDDFITKYESDVDYDLRLRRATGIMESISNTMSTEDMIAYLRQHHDTNLHQDYLDHVNTNSKFILKDIPLSSISLGLSGLDRAKVEKYKKQDTTKAPPIVVGSDGYILDGYHRATAVKELGIPTIRAYVGVKGVAEDTEDYAGMQLRLSKDSDGVAVRALASGKELGMAEFFFDDQGRLDPQTVWVDERYHGQGIAAAMYDYLKDKGYTIVRSWDQTDAGRGFWDKHQKAGAIVWENFADGKKPGRKGLSKRVGVDCKQPVTKLRSIAKNSSGEKQRMAHWCANMKSGKKK
jgi:GNAT superfamily N-acetyltransferase